VNVIGILGMFESGSQTFGLIFSQLIQLFLVELLV